MLIKLYTNSIPESSPEATNLNLNIFNLFVSHSSDSNYMKNLYIKSFKYMGEMENENIIKKNIEKKQALYNDKKNIYNNFIEENNTFVWEKFSTTFVNERKEKEMILLKEVEIEEKELSFFKNKMKQYNFFFSLNFDFFIYFLKYHYTEVKEKFLNFLQITKNSKIIYIISYYLTKHKLKHIIIDIIYHLKLSKELCSLFMKTYDYEIIVGLINVHSSNIVNFAIIYQVIIQNKDEALKKIKIKNIDNVYIKYIYEHLEKTQPKGLL